MFILIQKYQNLALSIVVASKSVKINNNQSSFFLTPGFHLSESRLAIILWVLQYFRNKTSQQGFLYYNIIAMRQKSWKQSDCQKAE